MPPGVFGVGRNRLQSWRSLTKCVLHAPQLPAVSFNVTISSVVPLTTLCLIAVSPMVLAGVVEARRLDFIIAPTYSICVDGPACSSVGRTTLTVKYKPVTTKKQSVRIELARAYLQSSDEPDGASIDVVEGKSYEAATDVLSVKLAKFSDGFERSSLKLGALYQHSTGGSTAYHSGFGSYDFWLGRQIQRSSSGPAHQFDVLLKISRNVYQSSTLGAQNFIQLTPSVTFPLDPDGTTRVLVSYAAQQQFAGGGKLSPYSSSTFVGLTHNFSPSIKTWARIDWTLLTAPAPQQTTTVKVGAEFTL